QSRPGRGRRYQSRRQSAELEDCEPEESPQRRGEHCPRPGEGRRPQDQAQGLRCGQLCEAPRQRYQEGGGVRLGERRSVSPDRQDGRGRAPLPRQAWAPLPVLLDRDRQGRQPRGGPWQGRREALTGPDSRIPVRGSFFWVIDLGSLRTQYSSDLVMNIQE